MNRDAPAPVAAVPGVNPLLEAPESSHEVDAEEEIERPAVAANGSTQPLFGIVNRKRRFSFF